MKKTRVLVSLPSEIVQELDEWAEDEDMGRSEIIEVACDYLLSNKDRILKEIEDEESEGDEGEEEEEKEDKSEA